MIQESKTAHLSGYTLVSGEAAIKMLPGYSHQLQDGAGVSGSKMASLHGRWQEVMTADLVSPCGKLVKSLMIE